MFGHLQIPYPRERRLVGIADAVLAPLAWAPRRRPGPVRRVLLLRLERIGDLLMVLEALRDARAAWPEADLDLAVGSWNAPIASLVPGIARVELMDVPWLARGASGDSWSALVSKARAWKRRDYDLVLNFEPDIRSNALAWMTGATRRFGYSSGGGGAFLTDASPYVPTSHVSANARALVAKAAGRDVASGAEVPLTLKIADEARERVRALIAQAKRPLVGVHASGGRESKQWHLDRFAAAARDVAAARHATIVLTGGRDDRALVDQVRRGLERTPVVDVSGMLDLDGLAALLAELDVLLTGDTGPMHLAASVGTPVVALFGPSDPRRYGPIGVGHRVLRVDLPCSPCGQVRLPPERCRGHVPDCLDQIHVARVVAAVLEVLDAPRQHR